MFYLAAALIGWEGGRVRVVGGECGGVCGCVGGGSLASLKESVTDFLTMAFVYV